MTRKRQAKAPIATKATATFFAYTARERGRIEQDIGGDAAEKQGALSEAVANVLRYISDKAEDPNHQDIGAFEKGLLALLLVIGLKATEYYLAGRRQAPKRRRLLGTDGRMYKYVREARCTLRSVFGEGSYVASEYQRGGPTVSLRQERKVVPLDSQVGLLPLGGGFSPVLALEAVELTTRMSYEQALEVLQTFRPYVPSKRSLCGVIDLVGAQAETVLDGTPVQGGETAVIQVDARGAPKIREAEYKKRCKPHRKRGKRNVKGKLRRIRASDRRERKRQQKKRRKRGENAKGTKRVTVGLIYALNRCEDGSWEGSYGKFIARFGAAEDVFKRLKKTLEDMGDEVKQVVFISDGAPEYRRLQLKYFPEAKAVIDFYHVCEYLWKAGETIYQEGSEALENFVSQLKQMLLSGQVHEVLSILCAEQERIAKRGPGTKGRRKRMANAIAYISKRIDQMPYKELRDQGLEIGSGAIEGAVRQIVAIRLDGPGMRWGDTRPQLLLHMLCLRLSGAWEAFVQAISTWSRNLHPQRRLTPLGVNECVRNTIPNRAELAPLNDNTLPSPQTIAVAA